MNTNNYIGIELDNKNKIKWLVYDQKNYVFYKISLILNLSDEEYKRVRDEKIHSKIIFEELNEKYKDEIENILNHRKNEAA